MVLKATSFLSHFSLLEIPSFELACAFPRVQLPRPCCPSSQVNTLPNAKSQAKESARKTGRSMPHCVVRWVWLLRVLRSGGE
jgi:hypothetical protein